MNRTTRLFSFVAGLMVAVTTGFAPAFAAGSSPTGYLVTNDDNPGVAIYTATFYAIAADGTLGSPTAVRLGGHGSGGGFFAANRVSVQNDPTSPCVFLSEGTSNKIVGVHALTQTVSGTFAPSAADLGNDNGIGLVMNGSYLYANFSSSASIATFAVQSGCQLQFVGDIFPSGLNGGTPKGMALHGNMMIVTYGDGSIESFNIAQGVPVSNGDAQNSAGFATDEYPDGVVITSDGHYAILGDDSSDAAVEVSDISSGKLTQTIVYSLPSGFNSNNVVLSPDETLLYIVNNTSGQVSAAFFDKTTGAISGSCISAQLSGFDSGFSFLSTPVPQQATGTGSVLYVAEFGSSIAVINVSVNGGACTLTEAASSPVADPNSVSLLSLGVVQITQPGIYSPVPGSTLTGPSATFQWNSAPSATAYWLDLGSTAGGNQIYQSGSLSSSTLSQTVNTLPEDGSTIYATWYYLLNGSWVATAYTYTAAGGSGSKGVVTSPAPGSTLSGSTVTFNWSAGTAATAYWMDIGSAAGGNQYYQSGNFGNALTTTVNGLPTNGSTVYVTLYSLINGIWTSNAYTYSAFSAGTKGVLTTPTPGSMLTGSTVTFSWNAGTGAAGYWLDIGNVVGGNQYYQSGNLGNALTTTAHGLPSDGSTIYATLYTLIGGQWMANGYTYTAFNSTGALAVMQTPTPGSTLSGNTVTFTWSADPSASAYWVDIGNVAGGNQYYQSGNLGNVLTTTVHSLPANNTTMYVTLYSLVGGQWMSTASTYTSGP